MKKFFILAFVAIILTGCSSSNPRFINTATYSKADVEGPKVSVVADLEISPVKISYSYVPSKAVSNGGFDNILNTAVQEALYENGQADVLVALEYHAKFDKNTEDKKLFHEISLFFYMKTPKDFEPVCKSFSGLGNKEKLMWISPKTDYTIYPDFFKTELTNPSESVKHFVTDER